MAKTILNASAHLQEGLKVKIQARGFEVTIDEPIESGGTNTAMNPPELLLGVLGACQSIVARTFAKRFNIQLDDFWVEVIGELDEDRLKDLPGVRPGYSNIRYNIHIKSDSPKEKIEEFVAFIEKHCPVGDSLANPVHLSLNEIMIEKD
ncbi:OsmC family protein [Bacillus tuaregi]|uniref:OsmC family protein n=1 Tax=Bacillus tuaregi TaxID=1816695 RepID=UPI0008F91BC6|nr:OsmC family protein [Bacillus tuaregi]